jgi:GNAT superfamily N-acetyltransferase
VNFQIRSAKESDTATILNLIKALAEYEKLAHAVIATEEVLKTSFFGSRPAAECVLAELDGKPVGFAVFFQNFSTFIGKPGIYLEDLFVKPEVRGKGFGKKLLQHVAEIARERNCERFEWAVLDWNKPAIEFYDRIGAKPLSDWIIYRLKP